MHIREILSLQALFHDDDVKRRIMAIYVSCINAYLDECRHGLGRVLGVKAELVLLLFDQPCLIDGLGATLMEQFPNNRDAIHACLRAALERYTMRIKGEEWAYVESIAGISAYFIWASVM